MVIIGLDLQRILEYWGLELFAWEKVKDVYKVYTNRGVKNLKVSLLSPSRLLFVHQALIHLNSQKFDKMRPLVPTLSGDTYVSEGRYAYSLFDWIEGRQCNFENETELISSTQILAEFHQKSSGFTPPENLKFHNNLGKCLKHFEVRYQSLLKFKEAALLRPQDPFAKSYLENIVLFLSMAEKAIAKLKQSSYPNLVERTKVYKTFCHGDPAARNFILTPNQRIFIIDFDNCQLDLPIIDLIRFARRVLKKCHWRYQIAKLIMDSYQSVTPLSFAEIEVMKAIFYFPQKFWRLAVRYFHPHQQYSADKLLRHFRQYLACKSDFASFQAKFENYQSGSRE
jgi:spore coat protein, CotS family